MGGVVGGFAGGHVFFCRLWIVNFFLVGVVWYFSDF